MLNFSQSLATVFLLRQHFFFFSEPGAHLFDYAVGQRVSGTACLCVLHAGTAGACWHA